MSRLQNKVAVITGGTSGIGLAAVQRCQIASKCAPLFAAKNGSDSLLVQLLTRRDDACLEEIDFCTPIHLSLHELEFGDLTFGLTVRPWMDDRGLNGVAIRDDALGERAEWTVDRGGDPWIEIVGLLLAHDLLETIDQVAEHRARSWP
jgi:NAD(P)-dependent dehydrogenase (short-subunit alcohol dehydrogenase family)